VPKYTGVTVIWQSPIVQDAAGASAAAAAAAAAALGALQAAGAQTVKAMSTKAEAISGTLVFVTQFATAALQDAAEAAAAAAGVGAAGAASALNVLQAAGVQTSKAISGNLVSVTQSATAAVLAGLLGEETTPREAHLLSHPKMAEGYSYIGAHIGAHIGDHNSAQPPGQDKTGVSLGGILLRLSPGRERRAREERERERQSRERALYTAL
jgi:hypothetical protein